jgi:hypothetical protein
VAAALWRILPATKKPGDGAASIRRARDGKPHKHEHMATKPEETYNIRCGPQTVVKSFTVELAN